MRLKKRLMVILLAIALLVVIIPPAAIVGMALDIDSGSLDWGNEQGITRAQWLHNLVVVFEMEAHPDSLPDNYFSDLSDNHRYYEDILVAVEFGVVDVGAGYELQPDALVTRDFAAYTLNFCLGYRLDEGAEYTFSDAAESVHAESAQIAVNRGWFALEDGRFLPQAIMTAAEAEFMLTDAAQILEKEIVDPDYDSTFAFREDVIVLEDGTEVSEDENGVVTVMDSPVTIVEGDKFAVFIGGIPRGYRAVSVTSTDNETCIVTEDLSLQDTFVDLDMQGMTDGYAMEFTPIGNAQLTVVEERDSSSFFAVKKTPTLEATEKINLGNGVSVSVSVKLKNPRVEYEVNANRAFVKLVGDAEITYKAEASLVDAAGESISMDLCNAGIPGVGGFTLSVEFELSGSASGTVAGQLVAGVECTYGGDIREIKSFSQRESYFRAEATCAAGIKAKFGITKMPVINAYVYAEVGAKATVSVTSYSDGTPASCSHFAGYLYAEYGAEAKAEFFAWEKTFAVSYDIFDDSNSPVRIVYHYEDGRQVANCTRGTCSGAAGSFGGGFGGYFTNSGSRWGGSGWSGADGAYGVDASGQPVRLFDYTLNENNEATITKYHGNAWSVYIPDTIDGYTVIGIGNNAFKAKVLSAVDIPDTVTFILNGAFYGCTNLREVVFPESMETLHCGAFEKCRGLQRVYITKDMRAQDHCGANYMYPGPFIDCENLTTIDFEEGITRIPHALFINCPGLEHVTIPDTVTTIHTKAFAGCVNLQSVSLPEALLTIETDAFANCAALTDVVLPAGLQTLGCGAFQSCTSLEHINIPKDMVAGEHCGANYMYPGPFKNCENLNDFTFAEGITRIPNALFIGCSGLESITIPDTVTAIRTNAFSDCLNLQSVTLPKSLTTIDGYAFSGSTALREIILPDSVSVIGCGAFQGCTGLERIHIPAGVRTGEYCGNNYYPGPFNGCSGLKEVTFGEGFTTMPDALFWNATGLETITLPDTLTNISWKCFASCTNLTSVVIPASVTNIGDQAFHSAALQEVTIPDSVTQIGSRAFQLSGLVSITIPDSVTNIGDHVVADCPNLKSVVWSAGATTIRDYSFAGSVAIESVTLPDTVKTLHKGVFRDCDALKSMVLPNSIETIGNELFYGCDSLETAVIPNSVTSIGSNSFTNCPSLTTVTLSAKLKRIPGGTFQSCAVLEEVIVPNMVTAIDGNAFASSPALKKVYLPRGLTTIADSAFSYKDVTALYGVPGTYAETWANEKGYQFVSHVLNATDAQLSHTELSLYRGKTENLILTYAPADMNDEISFKSTDTAVATVTAEGQVRGVGVGEATIKVTVGDITLNCHVTVLQPVTGLSLNKSSLSLQTLETYQLTVTVRPDNAYDRTVTWSTSDDSVVTVTQDGLITALKKGTATITVRTNDGSAYSRSCSVTVTNNGYVVTDPAALESEHNYPNSCNDFWVYTDPGKAVLEVTFDSATNVEEDFDYLYIYDGNGVQLGRYTGTELAGETVSVQGDTVKIQLQSDGSGTAWGFKVSSVVAADHIHDLTNYISDGNATCTGDGTKTAKCDGCGETHTVADEGTALGHDWSEWEVTVAATYTSEGVKTRYCKRSSCDAQESESVPKLVLLSTPTITKFENQASGIKLTWGKVNGAAKYRVFVKTSKGWTKLADTSSTSYIYTGAQTGLTYTFTVRCLSADGKSFTSAYNTAGWKCTYSPTPVISGFTSETNGIKLSWTPINGAAKYRVFVKTSKGWVKLGDTASTNYTYTAAKTGLTYTFTVRAINAAGTAFTSAYNTTGWKYTYSPAPVISGFVSEAKGIKLSWNAINGAAKYRVFVKTSKGWVKLADTTGTSYTYTGAKTGLTYTFTVRCLSADGKSFTSAYNTTGWKHTYSPIPVISGFTSEAKGLKINWNAINGAAKYRVFVKTSKGWTKLGDTTGTSFVYTGAKLGVSYNFTVRCLNAAGTAYTSSYMTTGWKGTYAPVPEVKLTNTAKGIQVSWSPINGAVKYRVFVKTSKGWTKVTDTAGIGYVYTAAKPGLTYTFTVRCINAAGTAYTSGYNTTGWSIKRK